MKPKVFDTACGLFPVKSKRTVWEYVCSNPSAYQNKDRIIVISNTLLLLGQEVCAYCTEGSKTLSGILCCLLTHQEPELLACPNRHRNVFFIKTYLHYLLLETTCWLQITPTKSMRASLIPVSSMSNTELHGQEHAKTGGGTFSAVCNPTACYTRRTWTGVRYMTIKVLFPHACKIPWEKLSLKQRKKMGFFPQPTS